MTTAPSGLVATRRLLLAHLDIHENSAAYTTDLDPVEVGIVGDTAHVKEGDSYHLGTPEQSTKGTYSVLASPRDRAGLCQFASALDIGQWSTRVGGKTHNLPSMSVWLVAQCKADSADTRDIREIIYSPDGTTVKRWDRLGHSSTGDSSHLFHTHISLFRDATKAGRGLVPLMTRYLTEIGLIAPEVRDMQLTDKVSNTGSTSRTVDNVLGDLENVRNWLVTPVGQATVLKPPANSPLALMLDSAQRGQQPVELSEADRADIAAKMLAGLPAALAGEIADILAARLKD